MDPKETHKNYLTLPTTVVSRVDIGRLIREVEMLHNFLTQGALREPGTPTKLPKTSRLLDEIIQINSLNVLQVADREWLYRFLLSVKKEAPSLHMSFSADPSPFFMQKLVTYIRNELHPLALVQVGLQPTIGAGCMLRTTNKYFDFSLRAKFKQKRPVLMQHLMALRDASAAAPVETPESPAKEVAAA